MGSCQWDASCQVNVGLVWRDDIMGGSNICPDHCAQFDQDMFYVLTPLNTNYRAGDHGGDMTLLPAPEADYYTDQEDAILAAKVYNQDIIGEDALAEQGAFVVKVVRWATDP